MTCVKQLLKQSARNWYLDYKIIDNVINGNWLKFAQRDVAKKPAPCDK